ncbi:NADP-dependent 3-hydroxy acid dehydrogenase YdfG [Pedobacter cryoconitis]|uniref:NADP-dependent 3-hydroxy acid dehydrogenase YdfG n=1 Tax=Pedobacter cryoconitis TaxID=188932 RepID=A0A7W8YPV3_9SPHI|nr:SDR family oxidoreductase [Pedobacter cryoconitis]MBB5619631.1 NADP-dependent 3-hydroxy acid dehydrogenase YdfG [Pedobacter cryoconitis]MBB5647774.1 NADP-dependent 3-hydroxy acid dehydrogenase YdfG [Pedobacter cryoconitis]
MKTALITGATSGIGKSCAHLFAQQGYQLVLVARREEKLKEVAKHLADKYAVEIKTLIADVRDNSVLKEVFESLPEDWKKVDVLINNAGLSQGLDPVQNGDTNDWDTMIDTNVKGLLYVTKIVSNWMIAAKKGHIINIGSIAGKEVYPNGNVYCATKHAVDALNKGMRLDLLPHGIKVTAINPGMVETEFSVVRFKGDEDKAKKVYEGLEPLLAQDIADAIWFAVSRPAHVNINDMLIMPTAQASATVVNRN